MATPPPQNTSRASAIGESLAAVCSIAFIVCVVVFVGALFAKQWSADTTPIRVDTSNDVAAAVAAALARNIAKLNSWYQEAHVFYGGEPPAAACEPLQRHGAEVAPRPCDRAVYCVGSVCVGNVFAAANWAALDEAGVMHIVSALGTCKARADAARRPCLDLMLEDTIGETNIMDALRTALAWRKEQPPGRRTFVHCAAGVSRSATIAIAFLMEDTGSDYDTALALLRKARPVAQPNPLFELALRLSELLGVSDAADCALKHAVAPEHQPCGCGENACAALSVVAVEHGARLPPFPLLMADGYASAHNKEPESQRDEL